MWSSITPGAGGGPPPPTSQWGVGAPPQQAQQAQQSQGQAQAQQQKHDIFVGNLAFSTTEEHLHQAFSEIGRIIKVRMVTDLETGKPRGFAFIEFEDPQAALSAIRNMNDYELNGRRIRVNFSNSSHLETMAEKLGMRMSTHGAAGKKPGVAGGTDGMAGGAAGGGMVRGAAGGTNGTLEPGGSNAVASALQSMSKGEMYDVVKKLKEIADGDPDEARKLISGHPQLPEAILFLMGKLDMINTPNPLDINTPAAPIATQPPPPSAAALRVPPPDAPPPHGLPAVPPRTDPRASNKPAADPRTAVAAASASNPTTGGGVGVPPAKSASASRPADPRARSSDPRSDPRKQKQQQQQQQRVEQPPPAVSTSQPPPQPPLPVMMPPHRMPGQMGAPPNMVPPPLPLRMAVPPPAPVGVGVGVQQQPGGAPSVGVAGLDPTLVQEVMKLTKQQIEQLPLDKQQGILALRQQITNPMGQNIG